MRNTLLVVLVAMTLGTTGCGETDSLTYPSPVIVTPTVPLPRPPFPSINVGEPVRFQFTAADYSCVGAGGGCKSYLVTAPVAGQLDVVLGSVSGDPGFTAYTEMYVVPGADAWLVSGTHLTASVAASAGTTYEIRMYSPVVPSVELELLATLR